ncbi:MAG: hypothetical protein AAGF91_05960 [Actinomycetota bacterium]
MTFSDTITADPITSDTITADTITASGPGTPVVRRAISAILLALVMVVATACGSESESSGPEQPTFEFIIPAGSGDLIEQGEVLDILPRELKTQVGETIQIRNEDDRAHILGPWFVGAGETLRQRFVTVGVFEGACSVHPSGAFTVYVDPSNA